jgi:penicillin-binding protein 1C
MIAPYPVTDFAAVRGGWHASDAWLLDRNGEPLSRVRIDRLRRRGDWVTADEVSPALTAAVLASEDKRFREHGGVDWLAMVSALRQTAAGERRGGSTLTMQLASYLNPALETGGRRNLIDKWRQMRQALALERAWDKDQILEAWLNLTPFRGEVEGVDAASRVLLGKRASGLDRVESALLAGLVRAPNSSTSRAARRACALLAHDERACLNAKVLAEQGLRAGQLRSEIDGDAPHLARKLLTQPGERLISTLDARLQRFASETLQRHLRELDGRNVEDGALIVIDNATGEALAWVGSSGELSHAYEVDGVIAPRQAGSTLKPFLYALALERRQLTAASILDDTPLAVPTPSGLYVPQNYDHSFKGSVSLRSALASSLNVPAVRTLTLIGYESFYRQLKTLGLETLTRDADHYGFALALGGADVTLVELTNAYRTLANGGRTGMIRTTRSETGDAAPAMQAIAPGAAFIVSDILADAAARALTFGLASPLATRYAGSVKTGTSKDMRDNWAIGFTGRYTVGVWVGNFSGEPMHDVSGVTGAAPVWREVMDFLHEGGVPTGRAPPAGLVRQHVAYAGGLEPEREEWFVAGTEMAKVTAVEAVAGRPRIDTPAAGAIYAIDPDIPRERQRIALTARGVQPGARFVLDDGRRVRADAPFLWLPQPGGRQIVLVDAAGNVLDRVRFEVRGLRPGRLLNGRRAIIATAGTD